MEIWQKKENNELEKRNRAFLINQDENGIARVYVGFESEDVRLNVEQKMELFDASQQDISYHINQILLQQELPGLTAYPVTAAFPLANDTLYMPCGEDAVIDCP